MGNFFHVHEVKTKRGKARGMDRYITAPRRPPEYVVATFEGNMPPGVTAKQFWKMADELGRRNAVACRTMNVALCRSIPMDSNIDVAKTIGYRIAAGRPFSGAVHQKPAALEGGEQPHCHLMISQLMPDGIQRDIVQIFDRYNAAHPEKGGWKKLPAPETLPMAKLEQIERRRVCAEVLNVAQDRFGLEPVDHRSNKERGLPSAGGKHLGAARLRRSEDDVALVYEFH